LGAYDSNIQQDGQKIYTWKNIKFRQGRQDRQGFSIYNKLSSFNIGQKTVSILSTLSSDVVNTCTSNTNNATNHTLHYDNSLNTLIEIFQEKKTD